MLGFVPGILSASPGELLGLIIRYFLFESERFGF